MTSLQIIGWKTYAVGVVSIILGCIALRSGNVGDGLKGIVFGLALIALRDAIGKILRAIDDNRKSFNNMRAAVEAAMPQKR
jgi:hypothetical protein